MILSAKKKHKLNYLKIIDSMDHSEQMHNKWDYLE